MKQIRDIELIREILLKIKDGEYGQEKNVNDPHEDYQLYLMQDAGLLNYKLSKCKFGKFYHDIKITSLGHDFIDAFENRDNFEGTKKFAKEKGQELLKLPIDVMIGLGKQYLKQQLGL